MKGSISEALEYSFGSLRNQWLVEIILQLKKTRNSNRIIIRNGKISGNPWLQPFV